MEQVITRDGVVICVTSVPYPAFIIRDMKEAGYKIRTEKERRNTNEKSLFDLHQSSRSA